MIISRKKLEKMIAEEKAKQEYEFERRSRQREEQIHRYRQMERINERICEIQGKLNRIDRKLFPEMYEDEIRRVNEYPVCSGR